MNDGDSTTGVEPPVEKKVFSCDPRRERGSLARRFESSGVVRPFCYLGLFQDNLGELAGRPVSRHGLSPSDMPLAAERSRRVAVAIPEVRISNVVAVSPRQQRAESLQQDVAHHEAMVGRRRR